jgi:hypothetical protein
MSKHNLERCLGHHISSNISNDVTFNVNQTCILLDFDSILRAEERFLSLLCP